MTRFRQLLAVDPDSTPGEEQERASAGLANAVKQSKLLWKAGRRPLPGREKCLLLAVAPYSQYDLVLLDLLDESMDAAHQRVPVYVTNLQDYDSADQLAEDFPGVGQVHQTPVAALCDAGKVKEVAWGKKARDLVAETLGLQPDELTSRMVQAVPTYSK